MKRRAALVFAFSVGSAGALQAQDPQPPPAFEYSLEGETSVAASPGEDVPFEVGAQILSLNIDEPAEGVEAFSMGIRISGNCTLLSTQAELESNVLGHLREALGIGFTPDFLEVDVTQEAGFTAVTVGVVLDFDTRVVLNPLESPHEVLTLHLEGNIPGGSPCGSCLLEHVNGLHGGGRPIRNVVTSRSVSVAPKRAAKLVRISLPPCEEHAAAALTLTAPHSFPPTPLASCKKDACFRFTVDAAGFGKPVLIRWADPVLENSTFLYLKRGTPADPAAFDFAAGGPGMPSPRLILPAATAGTWHVGAFSDVKVETAGTLSLDVLDMSIAEVIPQRGAQGTEASVIVLGGGFRAPANGQDTTLFRLVHEGGLDTIEPIPGSVVIVSPSRAEMVFDLSHEEGKYHAMVLVPGVPDPVVVDTLESTFLLGHALGHGLGARADGQRAYGRERVSRFTLSYHFDGDEPITAPLFKITGPPSARMRLDRECAFQARGAPLLVLGINPDGFAGKLSPGASYDLPIIFESNEAGPATFQVHLFTPRRSESIDWSTAPRPSGPSDSDWNDALPRLEALLGSFWPEHQERLAALATRLSRRGIDATSVGALYRHSVDVALGQKGPAAALGKVVHLSTRVPLAGITVVADEVGGAAIAGQALTDGNGDFALEGLQQGRGYRFRVPIASAVQSVEGTIPVEGDLYGLELVVEAEASQVPQPCPEGDGRAPDVPLISPQEDTFSLLTELRTRIVTSVDPNDKEAPQGDPGPNPFEARTYIAPGVDHLYTIRFENTGDAPAHRIVIQDTLGPEFDETTIRYRGVDFGEPAPVSLDNLGSELYSGNHRARFQTSVQTSVRPFYLDQRRENLKVDVSVAYDPESRTITWILQTLHCLQGGDLCSIPSTFEDGFLPPNQCPPGSTCPPGLGEGSVSFTVQVKSGLGDIPEIPNEALINFDHQGDVVTDPFASSLYNSGLPPDEPRLRKPDNGSLVDANTFLLWDRTRFAVSHELHLWKLGAADGGCGDGPSEHTVIPIFVRDQILHFPPGRLEHDACYRWQLIASNLEGMTSESEVWSFRTMPAPEGCPEAPTGLTVPSTNCGAPVLTWMGGTNATVFEVVTPGIPPARVEGNVYRFPAGLAPGTYPCRVFAINAACLAGIPSEEVTFEILECFLRGDSDTNGIVNITDAVRILNVLFLGIGRIECDDAADADDSGSVNITDSVRILNVLFLGIGEIPKPGAERCGEDPTADGIGCGFNICPASA